MIAKYLCWSHFKTPSESAGAITLKIIQLVISGFSEHLSHNVFIDGALFLKLGKKGGKPVADFVEAQGEGALLVQMQAVTPFWAGVKVVADAQFPSFESGAIGAVDAPDKGFCPERDAGLEGDDRVASGLEGDDGRTGVLQDAGIANVAPEVAHGADAAGWHSVGRGKGQGQGDGGACTGAGHENPVGVDLQVGAPQQVREGPGGVFRGGLLGLCDAVPTERESQPIVDGSGHVAQRSKVPAPFHLSRLVFIAHPIGAAVQHKQQRTPPGSVS